MASKTGQTSTSSTNLVNALNNLDRCLQDLKTTDAWFDEVEDLNAKLGVPNTMDRELHRRVASNKVSFYAQEVVNTSRQE